MQIKIAKIHLTKFLRNGFQSYSSTMNRSLVKRISILYKNSSVLVFVFDLCKGTNHQGPVCKGTINCKTDHVTKYATHTGSNAYYLLSDLQY